MRRFRFLIDDIAEEIVELDDDVTEKDVADYFQQWVIDIMCNRLSCEEIEEAE